MGFHKIGRPIRCVDFNNDGKYLVIGLKDGEIIIIQCSEEYDNFQISDSKRQKDACVNDVK